MSARGLGGGDARGTADAAAPGTTGMTTHAEAGTVTSAEAGAAMPATTDAAAPGTADVTMPAAEGTVTSVAAGAATPAEAAASAVVPAAADMATSADTGPVPRPRALARRIARRRMLGMLAAPAALVPASAGAFRLLNPCLDAVLPAPLASHEIVARAFDDIDPARVIDAHVHLLGDGGGPDGPWVGEQMTRLSNPIEYAKYRFFLDASCVRRGKDASRAFLDRLLACHRATAPGFRLMLLAFDQVYDEDGRARPETTAFHVPDAYARTVAARHPDELAWAASVHPYRTDAVEALDTAVAGGALAVKWLPNAMGIDPASPKCDPFYRALVRHRIPLLTHGGRERAVRGVGADELGNPLRVRRALDHGVRVIVAHCASFGAGVDLDAGPGGPVVPNVDLFARLMDDPRYEHLVMGDVSALMQSNRTAVALGKILERTEWHDRLLNGSDYPLPGVPALFDLDEMADLGFLPAGAAPILEKVQDHNPLLFDFVLKRTVSRRGRRFAPSVFETARHLDPRDGAPAGRRRGDPPTTAGGTRADR